MTISVILLWIAFAAFLISATGYPVPRVNLTSLGLALCVLSVLLGGMK